MTQARKSLTPPRPFEDVWPQLMALLISQGKTKEAWALELRREERIAWEIEQERREIEQERLS